MHLTDKQLKYVYEKATMFVFPSKYEGFGMPVLEAFSSSTPCVLSKTGSLPEVGADAALYFDPENPDELKEKIELLIQDQSLQRQLIEAGKRREAFFSWDKCYEETLVVYESLTESV